MRVAIYARVSTTAQAEEGYSLGAQVEDCTRYAKDKLQPDLIKEYVDDGYSGAFLERPALERLRQDLSLGVYDAVVCYDPDRLARGLSKQLIITDEIEQSGAQLHFCNIEYKRTPEGQLFYQIRGAFSGYEREKIKQRSMRGKLAKLKQGKPLQDYRIYGYRYINETYVINEAEAEVVRLIFRTYLKGIVGGVVSIANMLNSQGIPSPQGCTWGRSTVNRILKRQAYAGVHIANRYLHTKIAAHKITCEERPQSEWITIAMPQIVEENDFALVQEKLKAGKRFRRKEDADCLVQGLAVCGKCGRPMAINASKPVRYLRCNSNSFYTDIPSCGARTIRIDALDRSFWAMLQKVCSSKRALSQYIKTTEKEKAPDTSALQKELAAARKEKATLIEWWHEGIVSELDVRRKLQQLTAREKALDQQIKSIAAIKPKRMSVDEIRAIMSAPLETFEERQQAVRKILRQVVIQRLDKGKKVANMQLDMALFFR